MRITPVILTFSLMLVAHGDDRETRANPSAPATKTFYRDADGDGFGDPSKHVERETAPSGYVDNAGDCDDQDPLIHPGAPERCNNRDDNCNGQVDEGAASSCPHNATCQSSRCTAGVCYADNINAGNTTCGYGLCRRTVPNCVNGTPQTCTANVSAATPETCNGIDDNCDGLIDNGAFSDGFEPNQTCASTKLLREIASNQTLTQNATLYPSGDVDWFQINSTETAVCSCCGSTTVICMRDTFRLAVTLAVPTGAGAYRLCISKTCGSTGNCVTVPAGLSSTVSLDLEGSCSKRDRFPSFVQVTGASGTGFSCAPYTLSYSFKPSCRSR